MKGVIISNNPYHNNPSANLSNKEIADRMDIQLFYGDKDLNEKIKKVDADYIIAWVSDKLWKVEPLHRNFNKVILASGDVPKRFRDRNFKNLCKYHKSTGIIVENKCSIPVFKDYLFKGNELDYYWYPWGIDSNYIKDYKFSKEYDVCQLGQFNVYQYRREIFQLLNNNKLGIKYFRFWPNRSKTTKKEEISYETYCQSLNKSKISIGGCLQHSDYTTINGHFVGINFGKNLEIPGCRCCLLNTDWGDREELGFKDGENYVQFDNVKDCINKIQYYLENEEELKRITDNGFKLIYERHTNKIHVDNIMEELNGQY